MFCNGADRCDEDGACTRHEGDPCPAATSCEEAERTCTGCAADSDCPDPMVGPWSPCGAFDGTCDTTGTRSRTAARFACDVDTDRCERTEEVEEESCTRDTGRTTCGATECTGWSGCDYGSACATDGSRTRTCTDHACDGGTCEATTRTEADATGCVRSTDGSTCGAEECGPWSACSYATDCASAGARSRTCTRHGCSGGHCSAGTRVETDTAGCTRTPAATVCTASLGAGRDHTCALRPSARIVTPPSPCPASDPCRSGATRGPPPFPADGCGRRP